MSLPTIPPGPVPLAIIGGTGLSSLPSPPFTPVAKIPLSALETPWGIPSSPITILKYSSPTTTSDQSLEGKGEGEGALLVAFLARHGEHHNLTPTEIPQRANVAALKKLGVKAAIGWSAVGSLREEVRPRDFLVLGGVVDWTKGFRPSTFFENGIVGHVSMADPFDKPLSKIITKAISAPRVLEGNEGDAIRVHGDATTICIGAVAPLSDKVLAYLDIETDFASCRRTSILYSRRIHPLQKSPNPPSNLMYWYDLGPRVQAIPRSRDRIRADYDSWHETNEGVSVEMVMGHMAANSQNAKRAIAAIVEELGKGEVDIFEEDRLKRQSRGGIMGLERQKEGKGAEAVERLTWLFGDEWVRGK
ncbi:uncharacterized protein KY384_002766 [Bacidia gigantensis]|uniref:uncharacterized protein n=1 Tax=Bacidia gigantensis TaxID=2732470 RepID=UPI001D03ADA0|nr:uncharacterized protein KY384_002766 [Bacidia gigantensis]KAG8532888.1 hypothetical protein KY384_002766 [Bacidia gigantensis]